MKASVKQRFLQHVDRLIEDGHTTAMNITGELYTGEHIIDVLTFNKWRASCQNLIQQMGSSALAWTDAFPTNANNTASDFQAMFGRLQALRDAIAHDLLTRVEDLVSSDAFGGLLEQATELLTKGYVLAAGVLGRAVLEEHLRKLCDRHGCMPTNNRPTINDLNQSLYKATHIDKLAMQTATAMATIGNDCAHNTTQHTAKDVGKFLSDVRDFMVRHALS